MPRYKNGPRRPRYSSSDTDSEFYRPSPQRANTKSYTAPVDISLKPVMSDPSKDNTISTNDLYQLMLSIKENQDSLRTSLKHRITNLESKFTQEIQRHVKSLKDEMTLEFAHKNKMTIK